ncbi:MAG: hypothetical protein MK116_00790 [Phycisphaerales bacterium]|nr:hypothetical protein [Phycisphaerales bacterium]
MMKKSMLLSVLAIVAILVGGCGNPVDTALDKMTSAATAIEKAAKAGDQAAFLGGLGDAVNAMQTLRKAVESIPAEKRPEYAKKAQEAMAAWTGLMASSDFTAMLTKIATGPEAPKLTAMMQQMQSTMTADGTQF